MTIKVGINGFGRIGRSTLSHICASRRNDIEVVKLNATGPIESAAHLIKYDSVHGAYPGPVSVVGNAAIDLGRGPIDVQSTYDLEALDWEGCDVVLECTGQFNDGQKAKAHLNRGARRVLISAPAKNVDRTVVFGVNHRDLRDSDNMVSNGSCTTNCLAPLAKVLDEGIGIESGIMTTIHAYTGDQPTLDRNHKDLHRARGAALSIIPTTTGAAKAVGEVLPELKGKLDGAALRVPTPNVSVIDLVFTPGRSTSIDEINNLIRSAADGPMNGILGYDTLPLVSSDYNHDARSSVVALDKTNVIGGNLVRVMTWYDNEWGFASRMIDTTIAVGQLG